MWKAFLPISYIFGTISFQIYASEEIQVTADDCRPGVNTKKILQKKHTIQHDLACIEAEYKKISLQPESSINEDVNQKIKNLDLEKLICQSNKGSDISVTRDEFESSGTLKESALLLPRKITAKNDVIIYNKNMQKEALLLQKWHLEETLWEYVAIISQYISQKPEEKSLFAAYGAGKLLQYPEEDIILYYQKHGVPFEKNQIKNNPEKIAAWAAQNTTQWQPSLEKDKATFVKWMDLNKNLSIEELTKQNESLNEAIKQFIPLPEIPRTIVTPERQTAWWKSPAKIGAGIIAASAALYTYFASRGKSSGQ